MDLAAFHPYVNYATRYPFSKNQTSRSRYCYSSSLYVISEGKGILQTCGRTYHVQSGSIIYIPAGQPHDWIADTSDPMVHVCCYFDWSHVDRRAHFSSPSTICYDEEQLIRALVGPAFPYPIPEYTQTDSVRLWVDRFESFYTENCYPDEHTYMRSLKCQSYFLLFIEYFLSVVLQQQYFMDQRMIKVLSRLDQDLIRGELQSLSAYYQELQISRGYFFELFKKATGMPPTQYINHFRMIRAKEDLMNTSLSITDIAEKHGFSSVHYFSRLFRQLNGTTPRQYREARDERQHG
ncbi:AraC family transcriptional regulator [Paenibacillus aquistagni]|uniref:AraC-type DNA-binding protein n=1 Tax=Paenibacillus aquistagni TaxID=1852522 RepID=A0A1X7J409_9BACL|nr:helix-turn-helix domain-containing protein [Paenibacillus aquistagni]SMG21551.1 AraC-type DNA-binding protein [Paenibacillus aquistagni]